MPVDAHYAFDGLSEEDLRALFPQDRMTFSDQEYNSRIAQLASLFEGKTPADIAAMIPRDKLLLTDEQYAALIDQYRQSGTEVKNPDDFPPDTIWKEVKLLSPVSIQVDAVLRDLKGTTYTQSYDMVASTAVKGPQNKVVIGDAELMNHWLTAIEAAGEQDKYSEIGQLRLALAVSTALKRTSDFNIPELWEDTALPRAAGAQAARQLGPSAARAKDRTRSSDRRQECHVRHRRYRAAAPRNRKIPHREQARRGSQIGLRPPAARLRLQLRRQPGARSCCSQTRPA